MTDISIIIVNFNTREFLETCVGSVSAAAAGLATELIVVDNASTDGSATWIRKHYPSVTLLSNHVNSGFSSGVNQGLGVAHGRFLLVLNPDIVLQPRSLQPLVAYLDAHPEAGAITPELRAADGSVQREYLRKLPSLGQVLLFYTSLERWARKRPALVARFRDDLGGCEQIRQVEQIPGAFVLTSRHIIETVGGFDERFKLFFEDVDWSYRVRRAGYALILHRGVNALHTGAGSIRGDVADWARGRFALSLMTYYDLHCGRLPSLTVKLIIILNSLAVVVARTARLPFLRKGRDQCRSGRKQHVYLLRSAIETYVFHRSVPLIPSSQPLPAVKAGPIRDGG